MTSFQVGKTYWTRSLCDHECIIKVTVRSRTSKTLTSSEGKKFRIGLYGEEEYIRPWGKYSMSPTITASKTIILTDDLGEYPSVGSKVGADDFMGVREA